MTCNREQQLIEIQLKEAELAYHQLLIGGKPVTVERNGRKVTYSEVNISDLRLYIQELKAKLPQYKSSGRSPARFQF